MNVQDLKIGDVIEFYHEYDNSAFTGSKRIGEISEIHADSKIICTRHQLPPERDFSVYVLINHKKAVHPEYTVVRYLIYGIDIIRVVPESELLLNVLEA